MSIFVVQHIRIAMSKRLFDDFSPISREEWMEKIKKDLKGKSPETLRWTSEEGLELFPVFRKDDLPDPKWLAGNFPGMAPYLRGNRSLTEAMNPWEIRHDFRSESIDDIIRVIGEVGDPIQGIGLVLGLPFREFLFDWKEMDLPIEKPRDGMFLRTHEEVYKLLANIQWSGKSLHLRAGHAALPFYCFLVHHWEAATGLPLTSLSGTLDTDPFNRLGADPSVKELLDINLEDAASIIFDLKDRGIKDFRSLRISLEPHHFMGANAVQQIACGLSMAVDYIDLFGERFDLSAESILDQLHFQFPIDTDFFTEIAKIRAFRLLLNRLGEPYGAESSVREIPVHGHGSFRSMSSLDENVNMLRATTEAMSAIMGGCDSISLPTYNGLTKGTDVEAVRIARNVQLILREESFLGQVMDPVGGSYYGEYLTAAIAQKAWKLFQQMEQEGGYLAVWEKGELIRTLRDQRRDTDFAVAKGKKTLLGVNKYPSQQDKPAALFPTGYVREYSLPERDFFEVPVEERAKTMVQNISQVGNLAASLGARLKRMDGKIGRTGVLTRLAEPFEQLRNDAFEYEMDGFQRPAAFLWTFGPRGMRAARAGFALNLMGAGGFSSQENTTPEDPVATFSLLKSEKPMVVVFCSADDTYFEKDSEEMMANARHALPDTIFLLAGRPENWQALQENGLIDSCIYAGMDMPQFLSNIHKQLEIKQEEPQYEA